MSTRRSRRSCTRHRLSRPPRPPTPVQARPPLCAPPPPLRQALSSRRDLDPAAERSEHYKVAFEEVVDLVRQRRVYLRGGSAFVPAADLVSIVATAVRAQWSRRLATASHQWPALREEEARNEPPPRLLSPPLPCPLPLAATLAVHPRPPAGILPPSSSVYLHTTICQINQQKIAIKAPLNVH